MASPRPHLRLVGGSRPEDDGHSPEEDPSVPPEEEPPLERPGLVRPAAAPGDGEALPSDLDEAPPPRVSMRHVVLVGLAFQAMGTLSFAGRYFTLSRDQAVSPAAALLSVPGLIALYAGALCLARRPARGRVPFLAGAIALGLAVPFWGVAASWTWPIALGAMLGLGGAWIAHAPDPGPALEDAEKWAADEPQGRDPRLH